MSQCKRMATISFLYPPSLRTAKIITQQLFVKQQRRNLSLNYILNAKVTLGGQHAVNYTRYEFPHRNTYKINVLEDQGVCKHTLEGACLKLGNSGYLLQRVAGHSKKDVIKAGFGKPDPHYYNNLKSRPANPIADSEDSDLATTGPRYAFLPIPETKIAKKVKKKLPGATFHITPNSANSHYFALCMWKAYNFLNDGHRVELVLRGKGADDMDKIIKENPQLHLETILEAMPTGSFIMVRPMRDATSTRWIIGPPSKARSSLKGQQTRTVKRFQELVQKDLDEGRMQVKGTPTTWVKRQNLYQKHGPWLNKKRALGLKESIRDAFKKEDEKRVDSSYYSPMEENKSASLTPMTTQQLDARPDGVVKDKSKTREVGPWKIHKVERQHDDKRPESTDRRKQSRSSNQIEKTGPRLDGKSNGLRFRIARKHLAKSGRLDH